MPLASCRLTGLPEKWLPKLRFRLQVSDMPTLGPCGIFLQRRLVNTGAFVRTYPYLTIFPDSP